MADKDHWVAVRGGNADVVDERVEPDVGDKSGRRTGLGFPTQDGQQGG